MKKISSENTAILGFGNQAKAWALNLKDSGHKLKTFHLRKGTSFEKAKALGFDAFLISEIEDQEILINLLPDQIHPEALAKIPNKIQRTIIYAHGYSVDYLKLNQQYNQHSHLLLAPKTIASELRFAYETKKSVSAVYSLEFSKNPVEDEAMLFELAQAIGIDVGPFKTSFKNETKADLFSEQALLCGLYPFVINSCYNLLRKNGIEKEVSFLECYHESFLIMKAFVENGPEKFFEMISPNALIGAEKARELFTPALTPIFEKLMEDLNNHSFANDINQTSTTELRKKVLHYFKDQELTNTKKELNQLYE
jgi:ketol-acid reductoisomerase